jgi:pimeloyl-ACP methyl ester carboxylesterase
MKRVLLILSVIGILISCLATTSHCKTVVFYIGGWGMTTEEMESFSRSVPESKRVTYLLPKVISELVRPWHCADLVYDNIKKNNLLDEDLIFVSYSLGGTVAQWLLSGHPELHAKKLILVASPIGGYKFVPPNNFFSNSFPKELPIYVIAGNKGQDFWFLRNENDGVVDLDSALDILDQNLKDFAIIHADHTELVKIPEVQAQISLWLDLEQELPHTVDIGNNSRLSSSIDKPHLSASSDNRSN